MRLSGGARRQILAGLIAAGCTGGPPARMVTDARGGDLGNDADTMDVAVVADSGGETADAGEAGAGIDAGCNPCWYGHCIDPAVCLAAVPIEPGSSLTMQNTGRGGYGDCAQAGSSGDDPQLYYSLVIPAGGHYPRYALVTAAPVDPKETASIRVLSDCDSKELEAGARGGKATNGAASVCVPNATASPRTITIAVGNYSSAAGGLVFDLSAELMAPEAGCP